MSDFSDILFVIMDVMIMVMLFMWIKTSRKVIIEAKAGSKIIISVMFFAVAVLTFIRYSGWIRYVQTVTLIVIGVLFYLVKSGISEDGIVMTGIFTSWSKAGKVSLNRTDCSISFEVNHKPGRLYFKAEQMDEIRKVLTKKKVK